MVHKGERKKCIFDIYCNVNAKNADAKMQNIMQMQKKNVDRNTYSEKKKRREECNKGLTMVSHLFVTI